MASKKLKTDHKNNWASDMEQYLCQMPPEILHKIFMYLSPKYLVLIQEWDNPRLTEAAALRRADFRDCKAVTEELVKSFFTSVRNSCLQEIIFPQMLYINALTISNCVAKCKFLTKLNVSCRGLTYAKVLQILEKCKNLKELHWFLNTSPTASYKLNKTTHNLKKLFLSVEPLSRESTDICRDFLFRTEAQTEAYIYLDHFVVSLTVEFEKEESNHHISDLIVSRHEECALNSKSICIISFIKALLQNKSLLSLEHWGKGYKGLCVSPSEIHPISYDETSFNSSNTFPPIHTVVLIDDIFKSREPESYFKSFLNLTDKTSLKRLNHLSVLCKLLDKDNFKLDCDEYNSTNSPQMSTMILPDLFAKWSHLQEVLFANIHFDDTCTSLLNLQNLKTVKLPPCAISSDLNEPKFLEVMVSKCKSIENFALQSCFHACQRDTLTDKDLDPIHKWLNLKHLSLTWVFKLRTCSFLKRVGCDTKLTTLRISNVGPGRVCHFNSNLFAAIKMASNLKFLKIDQRTFNPSQPLFWKNIALSKSLEGLCITTCFDTHLSPALINGAIKELPELHLFHLNVRRAPQTLKTSVRKVMSDHGIQHPNVEVETVNFQYADMLKCEFSHYDFVVPSYYRHLISSEIGFM